MINIDINTAQSGEQQPGVKRLRAHIQQRFGVLTVLPLPRQRRL
jgi:hypothetical protein